MNERTAGRDMHVVFVAGEHEKHTLAHVEVALRMRGMPTMLVDAHADAAIQAAVDRLADGGLVVLGRGETFSGERIDAVRQLLAARGLPVSRTLTLGVDEGARALETRVLATVQRLVASGQPRHSTVPPVHSAFVAHPQSLARAGEADSMPAPPMQSLSPTLDAFDPGGSSSTHAPVVRRRWPLVIAASGAAIAAVVITVGILRGSERIDDPAPADELATHTPSVDAPKLDPVPPTSEPTAAREPVEIGEAPAAPAATPAIEDAPEVVAALRKRDVRALDLVVISPEAAKAADFTGASAYCDALVIGELDGWRLPEIGELLSMSRAKMVRRGSFWSATKGDAFGDLRLVLVIKRERISAIPSGWDAGRVVCVRERA